MKKVSFFHKLIATGFGSGLSPVAPGTAGALLACVIWMLVANFYSPLSLSYFLLGLIIIFTFLGVWSSHAVQSIWGHDPSKVVVDEMVGMWIALLAVPSQIVAPHSYLWYLLAAFILFRFFDILKPLGVRKMEDFPDGWGIMLDDILAGLYSFIILGIARWVIE